MHADLAAFHFERVEVPIMGGQHWQPWQAGGLTPSIAVQEEYILETGGLPHELFDKVKVDT